MSERERERKRDLRRNSVMHVTRANPSSHRYVDGVVFSKNVIHKDMRTNIPNSKVLLLNNALQVGGKEKGREE